MVGLMQKMVVKEDRKLGVLPKIIEVLYWFIEAKLFGKDFETIIEEKYKRFKVLDVPLRSSSKY